MEKSFILDIDGKPVRYDVLLTFYNKAVDKNFAVYTDQSKDEHGNLNLMVSTFDPESEKKELIPIENAAEWEIVNEALKDYEPELIDAIQKVQACTELEVNEMEQPQKFTLDGENYLLLATFEDTENNKNYVVYTSEVPDENGQNELLVGRLTTTDDNGLPAQIDPVDTIEEWEAIEQPVLEIYQVLTR